MLEIQEEEKYIQNIRQQRLKIEQFKNDVQKKDKKIKSLEEEREELRQEFNSYKKMAGNYQMLNENLKLKEAENENLREKMKKQVDEYEYSLHELQGVAARETEEKNKEIRRLLEKLKKKDEENGQLADELHDLSIQLKRNQENFEKEISEIKEKEKKTQDQSKSWKNFEKMLKDQVSELAHEKNLLQEKVLDLKSQIEQLKMTHISDINFESERKKCAELRQEINSKHEEIKIIRKHKEDFIEKAESEIKSLQTELDRAISLVARQENSIVELRMRKTEDDMAISNLSDLLSAKEDELTRIIILYEKLQRETTEIEYSEKASKHIKDENKSLKKQLSEAKHREEAYKQERKHISKLKMELFSQRNAEVSKLTDVLDAVISNKS